jgi:hypothetical protein
MKQTLFDNTLLKEITANKPKRQKIIPLKDWIIMSEKELIVCFLSNIAPYAEMPKKISNGRHKGAYTVKIPFTAFTEIEISYEIWQGKNNLKLVHEYMKNLECDFASFIWGTKVDIWGRISQEIEMTFIINTAIKKEIESEWNSLFMKKGEIQ